MDGLPGIAHYYAAAGAVLLALSWPAERTGRPAGRCGHGSRQERSTAGGCRFCWRACAASRIPWSGCTASAVSHRNLAPEAVIVIGKGEFALRDLGLAATGYRPGEGPASYQAPEQALGARMTRPGRRPTYTSSLRSPIT